MAFFMFGFFVLMVAEVGTARRYAADASDKQGATLGAAEAPPAALLAGQAAVEGRAEARRHLQVVHHLPVAMFVQSAAPDIVKKAGFSLVANDTILHLHPWLLAFLASFLGSALTVAGLVLQKQGARNAEQHYCIGDLVLSKLWIVGFVLVVLADFPLSMFEYSIAPISLIAPLSGITIVLNLVAGPYLLKERIHYWPDLPATLLITVGTVLTTLEGAHAEPEYDAAMLWGRFRDPMFQLVMLGTAAVVAWCMYAMRTDAKALEAKAQLQQPALYDMLLPALVAAGTGLFSNINLKAAGILLSSGVMRPTVPWFVLTVLPAGLQINYLNRGMQLYPQVVFVPIYTACLMLLTTFGGAVFYQDYSYMQWQQMPVFTTGVLMVGAGVGLFSLRSKKAASETAWDTQAVAKKASETT